MPNVLVITGSTAAGKTEYALRLAQQWGVPVINADSRQIYRDLPIGTAAPTADEQARVKHFLVGTHDLNQSYNAGMFERDALRIISTLISTQNPVIAIVCGGSMLYIDALLHGLDDIPEVPADVRDRLRQDYQNYGLTWLQNEVQRLDPEYWQIVDRQNPQRLLHCLELCRITGSTYSSLRKKNTSEPASAADAYAPTPTRIIDGRPVSFTLQVITRPREELYERINLRVTKMLEHGLLDEADRAFAATLGGNYRTLPYATAFSRLPNALRTVGYQELLPYFLGDTTLEDAADLIRRNTRHYAKRQLTWWRGRS